MFGFGAISEFPLATSSTVAGPSTHAVTATLSATVSESSTSTLQGRLVSSISASATVTASGELTKLGTASLSSSSTVASVAHLTFARSSTLSSSATIDAYPQPLATAATLSGSATVSGSGGLIKLGTATLSSSSTLASVQELQVGAASLIADIGTLSGKMTGALNFNAGGLSSSATVSSAPTKTIHLDASIDGSTSVSSDGVVQKLGRASLGTGTPFTSGFNSDGFTGGTRVSANGFVASNHLGAVATLTADAEVTRLFNTTLSAVATLSADLVPVQDAVIQSIASLTGNSVLLHGGSTDLSSVVSIEARLLSTTEKPDIVSFSLHVDKLRELNGYISKTKDITGYIDKGLNITSYIDKDSGITGYIDKIVEKTLVRER